MAAKTKQHFVPQFYLRNFASDPDQKFVNLFSLGDQIFRKSIPLNSQNQESYFYSNDITIEDELSRFEGDWAATFRDIAAGKEITEDMRLKLCSFAAMQARRTKEGAKFLDEVLTAFKEHVVDPALIASGEITLETAKRTRVSLKKAALPSLKMAELLTPVLHDLHVKVIRPHPGGTFVTSDSPVVSFNQAFHGRALGGSDGFALKGLQMFFPVSPELGVLLYDPEYYRVGGRDSKVVHLSNPADTRLLNALQVLNCGNNIFFADANQEAEVRSLCREFANRRLDSKLTSSEEKLSVGDITERFDMIWMRSRDFPFRLNFSFCSVLTKHRGETETMAEIVERRPGYIDSLLQSPPVGP
jgi:hypothetical protein